jgi:hypothetical protein
MDNTIWKYAEQVYGPELPMVVKRLVSSYEDVKKDAAHVVRAKESQHSRLHLASAGQRRDFRG